MKEIINKNLRKKILRMAYDDQKMRFSGKWDPNVDKKNTQKMKQIVREYGWPGKSLVGEDGAHFAWLLVQHADHDLKFQKKCLALMKKAAQRGEVSSKDIAYLTDRVRINEGKTQLYGTQLHVSGSKVIPLPISYRKTLARRRKRVGLNPLTAYLSGVKAIRRSIKSSRLAAKQALNSLRAKIDG